MAVQPDLVVTVKNSGVRSTVISSPGGAAMKLVQLDDVTPTPRANGEILTWIAANGKFEFHPPSVAVTPVGSILQFAQTTIPTTIFIATDGQLVSRLTYSTLFSAIGVKYGNGDGSTTFGLPDIGPVIPSWSAATNLPVFLEEHTQNTLPDGRLIIIGGINSGSGNVTSNVWLGTITGNAISWAIGTGIPAIRYHHTTVVLPDGRVLVHGGRDGGGGLNDTTYFGTVSGTTITWVSGTPYPNTTAQHTMSVLVDGRILVLGGVSTYQLAYFGTISGTTITWAAGTNIPFEAHQHTATIRNGGDRVVLIGGRDSGGALYNRVYIGTVNGNTITWDQSSYLPIQKSEHVALPLLDKHILVAGGLGAPYERTLVGSILSNTSAVIVWESVRNFPVIPELNSKLAGSLTNDGRVMISGGYNGGAGSSNTVFIGNPVVTGIRFA